MSRAGTKFDDQFFLPIKNEPILNKPSGGLWTSTFHPYFGSHWLMTYFSIYGVPPRYYTYYLLSPSYQANMYVIDSLQDLVDLTDRFPYNPFEKEGPSTYPIRKRDLNFEQVMSSYDGIHLTPNGLIETRNPSTYSLYGWDCECTLWFQPAFNHVKEVSIKNILHNYKNANGELT